MELGGDVGLVFQARGQFFRDPPAVQPGRAVPGHVFIGRAVGLVGQRLVEGDEPVAAPAQESEHVGERVAVEAVDVGQEDLRDLAAEGVAGELLEPGAHALEMGQVARAQ